MRSGFVSVIGRTNAGKSSLLNYLLNEKIALVSHKQNATRRKINAIVMHNENQIIFTDTPGLHKSQKIMNKLMIDEALKSMSNCDAILFVASVFDDLKDYENFLYLKPKVPHIVILNKIDLAKKEQIFKKLTEYSKFCDKFKAIIPTSTKKGVFRAEILDQICKILPEHDYFFDPEFLTDKKEKEIYRDFILEAIYESFSDEIPYSCDVEIVSFSFNKHLEIVANIITDNASKRQILVGKNGESIKRIGIKARKLINKLSNSKVFLNLDVKVIKNWTTNEKLIKSSFEY